MIEINLLPGAGRKARKGAGGPKMNVGAALASARERIREPWMLGAAATAIVVTVVCGVLYFSQEAQAAKLDEELRKAVQDSTRYGSVLRERETAEARRDTVLRSLNMIRAIDDDRFIWPHIMDEVSRALPPYTWLVTLGFTGPGQAQTAISTIAPTTAGDSTKRRHKPVATVIVRDSIHLRLVGNTVDIQALTRFMKQLEASPFFEHVELVKSERANDNGKEVTQFQLDMSFTRPGPADVRRVPLAVSVR